MSQASSSENDDELETNSVAVIFPNETMAVNETFPNETVAVNETFPNETVAVNETFSLTLNFTVINVLAHTEYTVRAVATYAQASFANRTCSTTQYEGQPLSLTTSRKHWFTYLRKCLFCMEYLVATRCMYVCIRQSVDCLCRDGTTLRIVHVH